MFLYSEVVNEKKAAGTLVTTLETPPSHVP